jgi:formyltetrahydrofolate synthetase
VTNTLAYYEHSKIVDKKVLYRWSQELPIEEKIAIIARKIYGAADIELLESARAQCYKTFSVRNLRIFVIS